MVATMLQQSETRQTTPGDSNDSAEASPSMVHRGRLCCHKAPTRGRSGIHPQPSKCVWTSHGKHVETTCLPWHRPGTPTPPTIPEGNSALPEVLGIFSSTGAQFSGSARNHLISDFSVATPCFCPKQHGRGTRHVRVGKSGSGSRVTRYLFFALKRPVFAQKQRVRGPGTFESLSHVLVPG